MQPVSSRRFGAAERRLEEAARRRPAPAELLVDVIGRRALVVAGVEIDDALDAGLLRRRAEGVEQIPAHARMLDPPFAAGRVMLAGAEKVMLVLLVDRQHVVPAPALEAELAPVIVVGGLAAHVDHGVDRRRAADHLAARIVQRAAVEAGHRFGLEHPVRARIADREQIADRDVVPDPVVAAAGFEQQHAILGIRRKAIGQHAAGRARADNDVVVFAFERRRVCHVVSVPKHLQCAVPSCAWQSPRARLSLPASSVYRAAAPAPCFPFSHSGTRVDGAPGARLGCCATAPLKAGLRGPPAHPRRYPRYRGSPLRGARGQ